MRAIAGFHQQLPAKDSKRCLLTVFLEEKLQSFRYPRRSYHTIESQKNGSVLALPDQFPSFSGQKAFEKNQEQDRYCVQNYYFG